MASEIRLSEFIKRFRRFGVEVTRGTKHYRMKWTVGDTTFVYTFATYRGGRFVRDVYEKDGRKALKLSSDDGISDEDWLSK